MLTGGSPWTWEVRGLLPPPSPGETRGPRVPAGGAEHCGRCACAQRTGAPCPSRVAPRPPAATCRGPSSRPLLGLPRLRFHSFLFLVRSWNPVLLYALDTKRNGLNLHAGKIEEGKAEDRAKEKSQQAKKEAWVPSGPDPPSWTGVLRARDSIRPLGLKYTHPIHNITNKDWMCRPRDSPQHSVITCVGKESEREWTYVYVKLNLCAAHIRVTQRWKSTIYSYKPLAHAYCFTGSRRIL